MKCLEKVYLSFVFVLMEGQLVLAFPSGGYELFCHDWVNVPGVANRVLAQTNTLLSYTLSLPPVIGQNHCAILSWLAPAVPVAIPASAIALPPLTPANQAGLAIIRFVTGMSFLSLIARISTN